MVEHQFDGRAFDYSEVLDALRCRETRWLEQRREWLVREQRRLHVEELAVVAVLDERQRLDDTLAATDGTTMRAARRKRATAAKLARQPNVAKAAAARRAARMLRYWWDRESGMLDGRFSLPDIDGATVEQVLEEMIGRMRPAKGEAWDTREHRGADALVELCRTYADRDRDVPTSGARAHFVVHVPSEGPATVAGIPLPDQMVERLRAEARIEPVLHHNGKPIVVGRSETVLSDKTKRVVKQRDGHCRWPGCDRRVGLEVHHLWPSSWGGSDEIWNLATVCTHHHSQLAPQGSLLLLGNPNHPAGLSLVDRDDLPALATLAADHARADQPAT